MPQAQESSVFVRGLLHDLEHGLATMNILFDAIRRESISSASLRKHIDLLGTQLAYLCDVVDQSFVGTETETVDVRAVAEQVVRLAGARHAAKIRLVRGPAVYAELDATTLHRILSNLVDNAAEATGNDGRVDITIINDEVVSVEITDDGPGFDLAVVHDSSLGLRVVRELLDISPADLQVEPLPDGGTRVRVRFSRRRPQRPATARERIR
jgi:signal transduction histidine kinase